MQGQELDGTLKAPESQETTAIPVEGLGNPQPMEIKRLTLDEADLLRAERAFKVAFITTFEEQEAYNAIKDQAFNFSKFIIENCPMGKERSQSLGQIQLAEMWAIKSIENRAR